MSSGLKSINTGKGKPILVVAFIVTLLVSIGFVASLFLVKLFGFGTEKVTFYTYFYDEINLLINTIKSGAPFDTLYSVITRMIIDVFFAIAMVIFAIKLFVRICTLGKYKLFSVFKMTKAFFGVFVMVVIGLLLATIMPIYLSVVVAQPSSMQGAMDAVSPSAWYYFGLPVNALLLFGGGALVCIILTMIAGLTCPDIRMGGKHSLINLIRFIVYAMVIATLFVTPALILKMSVGSEYGEVSNTVIGGSTAIFQTDASFPGLIFFCGCGIFYTLIPLVMLWIVKPIKSLAIQNSDYVLNDALGTGKNYYNKINQNRCKGSIKVRLIVTGIIYLVIHFALKPILTAVVPELAITEFKFFLGFGIASFVGGIILAIFEKILEKTSPKPQISFENKE